MQLTLRDKTTISISDGSYLGAFIVHIDDIAELPGIASLLSDENLSEFYIDGNRCLDYVTDGGSWNGNTVVFNVRQKTEIEIVKPYIDPHLIPDDKAPEVPSLFDLWEVGVTYVVGDRVRYNNAIYRCLQEHTSQDGWTPDTTPALWRNIADPVEEWPEWVQPTGAHDAYAKGDKVSHNGKHWISTSDGNVWEPPTMWEEQV